MLKLKYNSKNKSNNNKPVLYELLPITKEQIDNIIKELQKIPTL